MLAAFVLQFVLYADNICTYLLCNAFVRRWIHTLNFKQYACVQEICFHFLLCITNYGHMMVMKLNDVNVDVSCCLTEGSMGCYYQFNRRNVSCCCSEVAPMDHNFQVEKLLSVRSAVHTAVLINFQVLWKMTLCRLVFADVSEERHLQVQAVSDDTFYKKSESNKLILMCKRK